MNWLNMFSGPIQALIRYGITAAGGAMVARGWVEASVADQVVGAAIAVVPAVVGALTSTRRATVAHVVAMPEVAAVRMENGVNLTNPEQVNNSAMNDR